MTNKTFYIETFGCQMNKSRSEHVAYVMIQNGYQPVENDEDADILLFNTCAVREHASEKAISNIQKAINDLEKINRQPLVVVFGCLSQFLENRLSQRIPRAQIVIGTANIDRIPQYIQKYLKKHEKILDFHLQRDRGILDESGYYRKKSGISAFFPITYGCNNYCSYCVVPYTTGPQRSKLIPTILEEIEHIIEEGYKEITLLGQNVNSYGIDLDQKDGFERLLHVIDQKFKKAEVWFRFLTSHPRDLRLSIVNIVKNSPILSQYFHLPLQSGSNQILQAMNRGYTQEYYLQLVEAIRRSIPESGIGTDIIVGFPGETERDFLDTLKVVEHTQFDLAYTYVYSPRSGTAAFNLQDALPLTEKKKRLQLLNNLLRRIHQSKMNTWIGKTVQVMVDQNQNSPASGRTLSNQRIFFSNHEDLSLGEIVLVTVKTLSKGKLYGEVVQKRG